MPRLMQYASIISFVFISTAHAAGLEAKPAIVAPDHAAVHVGAPKASVVDAVEKEKQGIQKAVQRSHINAAAEKAQDVGVKAPDSADSPMKQQAADYTKNKAAYQACVKSCDENLEKVKGHVAVNYPCDPNKPKPLPPCPLEHTKQMTVAKMNHGFCVQECKK